MIRNIEHVKPWIIHSHSKMKQYPHEIMLPRNASFSGSSSREEQLPETILGLFGFDRTVYSNIKKKKGRKQWYEELREERTRDIDTETME